MMKRKKLVLQLVSLLIVVGVCSIRGSACSCSLDPSPCEAFGKSSLAFIGRFVTGSQSRQETYHGYPRTVYWGVVTFEVLETFGGRLGNTITLFADFGCCDKFTFDLSESYLVYAYADEKGQLQAGTRTKAMHPIEYAGNDDDLKFLRNLPRPGSGARIYGRIFADDINILSPNKIGKTTISDVFPETPLANISVKVRGEGQAYELKTDSHGNYELNRLRPGRYQVEVLLPDGYDKPHEGWQPTKEFTVRDCGCAKADYWFKTDGRISGKLVDEAGSAYANVWVQLISADWRHKEITNYYLLDEAHGREVKTDADGHYELAHLPPGRYLLVVRMRNRSSSKPTFFPGVTTIQQAQEIVLEHSQKLTGYDLVLK